MSTKILLIYYGISLFLISGCVVCDSPSDDFLEFRLVDNSNKDLFLNHADFNKDSILIFSTLQNREMQFSSVLNYSGSDSFFRFSPLEFGQFYSNSKILISPSTRKNIFLPNSIPQTLSNKHLPMCAGSSTFVGLFKP